MSDPTPNLDPKEATEARLCAYLEGELAPAERAEIEQHLAANPQHRQLLADLARTREWMRAIPMETSPVDLAEIFKGQVERSMLLDDPDRGVSRLMLRWPQYAMLAAILLLTLGLGTLVVVMLKGPKSGDKQNFTLAPVLSPSTVAPAATEPVADRLMSTETEKKLDEKAIELPASSTPPLGIAAPAVSGAFGGGGGIGGDKEAAEISHDKSEIVHGAAMPGAEAGLRRSASDPSVIESVKARLLQAGYRLPLDQKTICFVVSADSPPAAVEQIRGFFSRHQLAYDDALGGKRERTSTDMLADNAGELAMKGAVSAVPSSQPLAMNSVNSRVPFANAENSQQDQNKQPQTQRDFYAHSVQSDMILKQADAAAKPTTAPVDQSMYLAYGLTPLQLELLAASLETSNLNQSVQRLTLSEGMPQKKQEIALDGAIEKGQTLTITVPQLVGPGIDKTNVVKVADDGTIALPMIDPVPAAGVSQDDLQKRIADKYREANLIPQATVSVTVAPPPPSTQATSELNSATTAPASQPVAATTQPVTPPSGVAVVVLVEKSAVAFPPK